MRLRSTMAAVASAAVLACAGDQVSTGPSRLDQNRPAPGDTSALADVIAPVTSNGLPARVSDLVVTAATDSSLTIRFTQVDDGLGQAASYDIRYRIGSMNWGSAISVSRGSCAAPLAGTAIGTPLTCTILGLEPRATYRVRLVSFRGTLNVDALFGQLSNTATGVTVAPAVIDTSVAAVTVAPAAATDTVGRTRQFQATVTDAGGTVRAWPVTWTSSNPAVMAVNAQGLATAVAPGSATITAASGGRSGTGAAQVVAGLPGAVTDLAVSTATDSSLTLSFTEVASGAGGPSNYDIRFSVAPLTWWLASSVTRGTCSTPVSGTAVGARRSCSITGLQAGTSYQVQLVSYRGTLNLNAVFGPLSNVAAGSTTAAPTLPPPSNGCATQQPGWIWCDDFEQDRLSGYFEYDNAGGRFVRLAGVGRSGSYGMRATWTVGAQSAGGLHLAIGRTPASYIRPADAGTANYRDIYWRMYVMHQPGWVGGGGDKLSRAFIFANSNWAQAAIAHVWSGTSAGPEGNYLKVDPASGTDASGNLITTTYNDFGNLRWLGAAGSTTPMFDAAHVGQWYCVEARMRLNDPGQSNGVQQVWINGALEINRTGLNWVGSYSEYGINAVYFENYWNAGSVANQWRVFDNLVVSTAPIGC